MKEIVKVFNSKKIRVVIKKGEPYFNAQDICNSLLISNTSDALSRIEKDDIVLNYTTDNIGRKVNVLFVSEMGLYDLVLRSRKKEAKMFKRWITHEVLPSIRKTGQYSIPDQLKKISTEKRNELTEQWKNHGCNKPHHYINLTKQEYKHLDIDKKKSEMNKKELMLLSALEMMEALKLLDRDDIIGYYDCSNSLEETGKMIKQISEKNKTLEIKQ